MEFTPYEQKVLNEVISWEIMMKKRMLENSCSIKTWSKQTSKQIPFALRNQIYHKIGDLIVIIYSLLQNSKWKLQAKKQLVMQAKTYKEDTENIYQLRQFPVEISDKLVEPYLIKYRLVSILDGALTGAMLPISTVINLGLRLRIIQITALSYGYDTNSPDEMVLSIKLLKLSLLPKYLQYQEWTAFKTELLKYQDSPFFYEENEVIQDEQMLMMIYQIGKMYLLRTLKNQRIPVLGTLLHSSYTYDNMKKMCDTAKNFYRFRRLTENIIR